MDQPRRIQLSRRKGWRLPPNTVDAFRAWIEGREHWAHGIPQAAPPDPSPLRGKNLACWCALDAPCHADVLLEIANGPAQSHNHGDLT